MRPGSGRMRSSQGAFKPRKLKGIRRCLLGRAHHANFDHVGGHEAYPNATVHLMDAEYVAATGIRIGFVPRKLSKETQGAPKRAPWSRQKGGELPVPAGADRRVRQDWLR